MMRTRCTDVWVAVHAVRAFEVLDLHADGCGASNAVVELEVADASWERRQQEKELDHSEAGGRTYRVLIASTNLQEIEALEKVELLFRIGIHVHPAVVQAFYSLSQVRFGCFRTHSCNSTWKLSIIDFIA